MRSYYDENFGHWDIEDEDDVEMYRRFQRTNVLKTCRTCEREVMLQPQYDQCDGCATREEQGLAY
jgi:hypothetical protein